MKFEWDENKNLINIQKHSLSFKLASLVFDDPLHLSKLERAENNEERWQTVGNIGGQLIILVAHTYKTENNEEIIRIISARKATKFERKAYEDR